MWDQNQREEGEAVAEALLAKAIGQQVVNILRFCEMQELKQQVTCEAVMVLEKIRAVLEDEALEDPECFQRIEAIVDALGDAGIPTMRHDW